MPAPRIIAKDYSDAIRFARETLGLRPTHVRVVSNAASLAGHGYTLHLAPGWEKNHAVHFLKSRLRYKRNIEIVDHAAEVKKESTRKVETTPDVDWEALFPNENNGVQPNVAPKEEPNETPETEETDAETGTPEPSEDAEGSEKPVQRRRRRCKTCGELVEPDDVEAHAAEHEAE